MKRILALDGGGIRGVFSLEILLKIEEVLRKHYEQTDPAKAAKFVLREHFDFLAGTSTGAIIATCLCWGMSVKEVMDLYLEHGPKMFQPVPWYRPIKKYLVARFQSGPLTDMLKGLFPGEKGEPATLGSKRLRNTSLENLLLVVVRNHTTGSAWPLTNNPKAKYNQLDRPDCNLRIPLWQLVRASTAAPVFFPPEEIALSQLGKQDDEDAAIADSAKLDEADIEKAATDVANAARAQLFVDGSITPYCNPALIAALTAVLPGYKVDWPTGPKNIRVVSVGTIAFSSELPVSNPTLWVGYHAAQIPTALLETMAWQQDYLCRCLGECLYGEELDSEVGDLLPGNPESAPPNGHSWFSYVRYNRRYKKERMEEILREHPRLARIDAIDAIPILRQIGQEYAEMTVKLEHLI
jgi:predicted acylesterase/phospholipase RssA